MMPSVWAPLTAISELLVLLVLALASRKLVDLIMRDGVKWSAVSQQCLAVIILGRFIRFLWNFDPYSVYRLLPTSGSVFLTTVEIPLAIIANLLLSFSWKELVDSTKNLKMQSLNRLQKFKWPLYVIILAVYGLELAASIGRALQYDLTTLVIITVVFYLIAFFVTSIFFCYAGNQLLTLIKAHTSVVSKGKAMVLRRMTLSIISITVGMVVMIIAFIIAIASLAPWMLYVRSWIASIGLELIALAQTLTFSGVTKSTHSGSGGSGTATMSTTKTVGVSSAGSGTASTPGETNPETSAETKVETTFSDNAETGTTSTRSGEA